MLSKRIGLMCLVAVLVVGLMATVGVGQWKAEAWDAIPGEMKTQIIYSDSSTFWGLIDDVDISVMFFSHTHEAWKLLLGDEWGHNVSGSPSFPMSCWENASYRNWAPFWNGIQLEDRYLVVAVSASKAYKWWPSCIDLTQGPFQFSVGYFDFVIVEGPFEGWKSIRPGAVAVGLIRIPSEIDLTEPFKIWIGEEFGVIKAFYGKPKQ